MSNTMNCPDCNHEILSRMGTICPNCGYTVGYFNGDEKRKKYGKFFALTVFVPFISFITLLFTSINKYTFYAALIFYVYLLIKSCPLYFKDVFSTKFEKVLFWGIYLGANIMMIMMIFNILSKGFES